MDMLQGILGGQQQRAEFDDFTSRYEQGAPWDGISDQEALQRYQQVSGRIPPDVYQQSAQDAFSRLTPQQRIQLGTHLRQRGSEYGLPMQDFDQDGRDDRYQDPSYLAQVTTRLDQQQPGILGQLLGGGGMGGGGMGGGGMGGGMLAGPIGKAALGGIAAMAVKRMMGG